MADSCCAARRTGKAPARELFGVGGCCWEDHRCSAHPEHPARGLLCEECEAPFCADCAACLRRGLLPPRSLANDMFTGYAPARLFQQQVTIMEMMCASPCITTLLCLSMEATYENNLKQEGKELAPLNAKAQMARHRFGARGNALTFLLPMEDLLNSLQAHAAELEKGSPCLGLPRTGEELAPVARVLLKTNKEGNTSEQEVKSLIHQAVVRREARAERLAAQG
ncbi:DUF6570 domain-containing protein [Pyruvatibacter mobilis]|uniref:DUF6570 domain-containing protein n=1 Tax=Pyruvatibacter mobilis TaxID=1712261 RepID=UPI003BA92056